MKQFSAPLCSESLLSQWLNRFLIVAVILLGFQAVGHTQEVKRTSPTWWVGGSAGANLNFFRGTTQMLNPALTTPAPFHKGFGVGAYVGALMEYRPDSVWGGILQVGYDDRRGSFNDVPCPCGEISTLSSSVSYVSIEPSLRIAPWSSGFYIFGGPQISFNWGFNVPNTTISDEKAFVYTREGVGGSRAEFSDFNSTVLSGQLGFGYDIPLADPNNARQTNLSPFLSFHFLQSPRSVESWKIASLRLGIAIKFGSGDVLPGGEHVATIVPEEGQVQFSVRAPKAVPAKRRVRETFPLRNYVFFDVGSNEIPNRYIMLSKDQASNFKEDQLQEIQPVSMTGRSDRQMTVYHNILNTLGDRMRNSPNSTILLVGSSADGAEAGKMRAEAIKSYLVNTFGIDPSRISTEGRERPRIPSEAIGGTKELALLREGDSRVDIETSSPELAIQVGGPDHTMLRPVQIVAVVEDPLDSQLLFNVQGGNDVLANWSVEVTDNQGKTQSFGPFTGDQANVSGNRILGDRPEGDYTIVMLGQTKGGKSVRKEAKVHLLRRTDPAKEAVRFSILFDFDKSKTIGSYEKFLTDVVTPLIPENGIVIIHGHTDIIGEVEYNDNLSRERVQDARSILERAIQKSGKRGITFETFGFGEDLQYAPFDNGTPEGRFYNRTVIIDIVPD